LIDLAGADSSARAALAACRLGLGRLLVTTGKIDDALAAYKLARADWEAPAAAPGAPNDARRMLGLPIQWMTSAPRPTGELAEAEYRRVGAIGQRVADDNPAGTGFLSDLAVSHMNVGSVLLMMGKPSEAEAESRRAIAILQKLVGENPAVSEWRFYLGSSHQT